MQAIMEPIFEIPYLIGVILLGILTIRRGGGEKQYSLFGAMAIVLGCGDAFHLIPRMWALLTAGTTALPEQAAALGFGKLVTSVTMTVFYVMLYHGLAAALPEGRDRPDCLRLCAGSLPDCSVPDTAEPLAQSGRTAQLGHIPQSPVCGYGCDHHCSVCKGGRACRR